MSEIKESKKITIEVGLKIEIPYRHCIERYDVCVVYVNGEIKDCIFQPLSSPYTIQDWMFLNELSSWILKHQTMEA